MRSLIGRYFAAQQFLTRLPCPAWTPWHPDELARSTAWFPLVGLVVGALAALAGLIFGGVADLPGPMVAVIVVAVPVVVTGFFHEDAWSDVCDAFGGMTPARRREIMRDSRVGSFGATGVALLVAAKVVGLMSLPWQMMVPVVIGAHILSRWSSLVMIGLSTYVDDPASLTKPYVGQVTWTRFALASAVPTVPVCAWIFGPVVTAGLLTGTVVIVALASRFFVTWLGGITGDCLGAVNQLVEVGVYLTATQPSVLAVIRHV